MIKAAAISLVAFLAAGAALAQPAAPVVKVAQGSLRGATQGAVQSFLGIPFAAPPVGERRWKAPAPPASWTGVRDATKQGGNCYQGAPRPFGPYTAEFLVDSAGGEDCLYLNVWAPTQRAARLPVLVWIHGGGYMSGSGSIPIYSGADLASKGAMVVAVNYRLGAFGFLAHPDLTAESSDKSSGNYGVQDLIAALQWVKANAAQFGGDPGNVTIAGQSAGASAVNTLIVSPAAKGLFHRAIAESGSGMGVSAPPLASVEAAGKAGVAAAGFATIADARAAPAAKVASIRLGPPPAPGAASGPPLLGYRPVVDGKVVATDPENAAAPVQSPVPLMTGYNTDEGQVSLTARVASKAFEDNVRQRYGASAEKFLALYPHATEDEATASANTIARDRYMASLLLWSQKRGQSAPETIYDYRFGRALPGPDSAKYGAFHTGEVPYVFGALVGEGRTYTAEDHAISAQMQKYWLNFMKTGNPNGAGLPAWAPAGAAGDNVMALGDAYAMKPAVSTPARLAAFKAYFESGNGLSLF